MGSRLTRPVDMPRPVPASRRSGGRSAAFPPASRRGLSRAGEAHSKRWLIYNRARSFAIRVAPRTAATMAASPHDSMSMQKPSETSPLAAQLHDTERLRYIDALRAIAALLVAWLHAVYAFKRIADEGGAGGGWLAAPLSAVDVGHIGVVVFFLISGFVIPFSIRPDRPRPRFLPDQAFLPLFPAYWLSVPLPRRRPFWIWGTAFRTRELLINLTCCNTYSACTRPKACTGRCRSSLCSISCASCCCGLEACSPRDASACSLRCSAAVFAAVLPTYGHGPTLIGENALFWFLNLSVMFWGMLYRSRCDAAPIDRDRFGGVVLWDFSSSTWRSCR